MKKTFFLLFLLLGMVNTRAAYLLIDDRKLLFLMRYHAAAYANYGLIGTNHKFLSDEIKHFRVFPVFREPFVRGGMLVV